VQAWAHSPGVEVQVLLPILRVDLFKESVLHICDNSTAWWLKVFHVYRHGLGQRGSAGYIFFGSVRKASPVGVKKASALNLRKGCKVQGQLVRLRR
jgi:ribosomal protein L14